MGPALACARRLLHGAAIAALTSKGHWPGICTVSGVEGCVAVHEDSGRLKTNAETERAQPTTPPRRRSSHTCGRARRGRVRVLREGSVCPLWGVRRVVLVHL